MDEDLISKLNYDGADYIKEKRFESSQKVTLSSIFRQDVTKDFERLLRQGPEGDGETPAG